MEANVFSIEPDQDLETWPPIKRGQERLVGDIEIWLVIISFVLIIS
jgi:hypothetical protein